MEYSLRLLRRFFRYSWDRLIEFLQKRTLLTVLLIMAIVIMASSEVLRAVEGEGGSNVWRAFDYVLSGFDIDPPKTTLGQITASFSLFAGVLLVSLLTGFVASEFSRLILTSQSVRIRPSSKMFEDHVIIFGWSQKTKAILRELNADFVAQGFVAPDILIVSSQEFLDRGKEEIYRQTYHVRGLPSDLDVLRRSDLARGAGNGARAAVILSNPLLSPDEADRKSLLTLLAIKRINPLTITLVEVALDSNRTHFENANADEIILPGQYSSLLLARTVANAGLAAYVDELLALAPLTLGGEEEAIQKPISFYSESAEVLGLTGKTVATAIEELHERSQAIIAGRMFDGRPQLFVTTGFKDVLKDNDRLIIIATTEQI